MKEIININIQMKKIGYISFLNKKKQYFYRKISINLK
jgi:hypothetical protein